MTAGPPSGGAAPLIASRTVWSGGPLASIGCRLAQSISGCAAGFTAPRFVMYGAETCELVGASAREFSAQLRKHYELIGRIAKAARIQPAEH